MQQAYLRGATVYFAGYYEHKHIDCNIIVMLVYMYHHKQGKQDGSNDVKNITFKRQHVYIAVCTMSLSQYPPVCIDCYCLRSTQLKVLCHSLKLLQQCFVRIFVSLNVSKGNICFQ